MRLNVGFPECLPADGVAVNNNKILAVNGFRCSVYDTSARCCTATARPYFFISSCCCDGGMLALSSRCGNKLYVLSSELEETESLTPTVSAGALKSAFLYPDRSGILLTYDKLATKCSRSGRALSVIGSATNNSTELLSCFPLEDGYLLAYSENGQTMIELFSDNEDSFILPKCLSFKCFAADTDGAVYALLGKGYPYSYLTTVYENGVLVPISADNGDFCNGV